MNKQVFEKLARQMQPYLPSFAYVKREHLICKLPVGNILKAILFESSGFSKQAFYPQAFVQPLYIPADYIWLTFGKRFSGNWEYQAGQEASLANGIFHSLEKEGAFRLWEDLSTPEKAVRNLGKYHPNPNDPYLQQAIAYSYSVVGDYKTALTWLDKCCETLRQMHEKDPIIKWHLNLLNEVALFRDVVRTNPEAARKQLDEWTEFTRAKLGLPE